MDLKILFYNMETQPADREKIESFFKGIGYHCYGSGYSFQDKTYDMAFDLKEK